ncbi:MAG: response regulator transcription factor [Calditrichaeota bacterium]|nr:response regulator transcription factor [Calditrichota bacterium]
MKTITVSIVEDHADFRNGLQLILEADPQIECEVVYERCEPLIRDIELGKICPRVVLMDIGLPGISGIEGVQRIKAIHPDCQVLMLTVYDNDANVFRAICAEASGYLLKQSTPEQILDAIKQVASGGIPMTPIIARKVMTMFREFAPGPANNPTHLTPREREVLNALVEGLSYKQIAQKLFISFDTVRNHLRHIYEKLQVHSKSEAVAKALKEKLL